MENMNTRKRSRSQSPPPWRRPAKSPRHDAPQRQDDYSAERRDDNFAWKETMRQAQIQENEQMREWVSKEDEFVLRQSKKKAQIRVREGRAKPIDWLAVILDVVNPTKELLEDEGRQPDVEIMHPDAVVGKLDQKGLEGLERDIEYYITLETNRSNRTYWQVSRYGRALMRCR